MKTYLVAFVALQLMANFACGQEWQPLYDRWSTLYDNSEGLLSTVASSSGTAQLRHDHLETRKDVAAGLHSMCTATIAAAENALAALQADIDEAMDGTLFTYDSVYELLNDDLCTLYDSISPYMNEGGTGTPEEWAAYNAVSTSLDAKENYFLLLEDTFYDIIHLYWPTHESLGDTAEVKVEQLEVGC